MSIKIKDFGDWEVRSTKLSKRVDHTWATHVSCPVDLPGVGNWYANRQRPVCGACEELVPDEVRVLVIRLVSDVGDQNEDHS